MNEYLELKESNDRMFREAFRLIEKLILEVTALQEENKKLKKVLVNHDKRLLLLGEDYIKRYFVARNVPEDVAEDVVKMLQSKKEDFWSACTEDTTIDIDINKYRKGEDGYITFKKMREEK